MKSIFRKYHNIWITRIFQRVSLLWLYICQMFAYWITHIGAGLLEYVITMMVMFFSLFRFSYFLVEELAWAFETTFCGYRLFLPFSFVNLNGIKFLCTSSDWNFSKVESDHIWQLFSYSPKWIWNLNLLDWLAESNLISYGISFFWSHLLL